MGSPIIQYPTKHKINGIWTSLNPLKIPWIGAAIASNSWKSKLYAKNWIVSLINSSSLP